MKSFRPVWCWRVAPLVGGVLSLLWLQSCGRSTVPPAGLCLFGIAGVFVVSEKGDVQPLFRESTGGSPVNVRSVDVASGRVFVLGSQSLYEDSAFVFQFDDHLGWRRLVDEGVWAFAVAPDGHRLLYSAFAQAVPGQDLHDLVLVDLATGARSVVLRAALSSSGGIDWHPEAEQVVFEGKEGVLTVVDLLSRESEQLGVGTGPRWSVSGSLLASLSDGQLVVYDVEGSRRRLVVRPKFLQEFFPPISWSVDDRTLFVNESAGPVGKDLRCVAVDAETGSRSWLRTGGQWCGPAGMPRSEVSE